MTDSIETSEREGEDPREPIRLPVREMRDEPAPNRAAQEGDLPPLLTDERLRAIHHGDEFGLFCDFDEFHQIARAIESEVRTAIAAAGGGVPQDCPACKGECGHEKALSSTNYAWVKCADCGGTGKLASSPQPEAAPQWVPCKCFDETSRRLCVYKDRCSRTEAYNTPASGFGPKLMPQATGFDRAVEFTAQAQPEAAPAVAQVPNWRDHVEQRIRTWRQRTMNKSGDRLAIDDFMEQDSIDDLVDFVCDEWSEPKAAAPEAPAQAAQSAGEVERWKGLVKQARDALSTYQGFIDDAHILEGQWHWLDDTKVTVAAIDAALSHKEPQR